MKHSDVSFCCWEYLIDESNICHNSLRAIIYKYNCLNTYLLQWKIVYKGFAQLDRAIVDPGTFCNKINRFVLQSFLIYRTIIQDWVHERKLYLLKQIYCLHQEIQWALICSPDMMVNNVLVRFDHEKKNFENLGQCKPYVVPSASPMFINIRLTQLLFSMSWW